MDIYLGKIGLTKNQIAHSSSLVNNVVRGFSFWKDRTVVVCSRHITGAERETLISGLRTLPDIEPESVKEKRDRKKRVMQKLSLSESDLQALQELVRDGGID